LAPVAGLAAIVVAMLAGGYAAGAALSRCGE
jgi:hypothetical protein